MTAAALKRDIERIAALDLAGLRAVWRQRYDTPPPLRSVTMLRQILAWRVQAEALGGLDRETMRRLRQKGRCEPEGLHLGIGARLTRSWQGRQVEVLVEEDGFRWEDRLFPSLSAVATAIAGSRWNGPRFFGLRAQP
jgi:hypothetical protein